MHQCSCFLAPFFEAAGLEGRCAEITFLMGVVIKRRVRLLGTSSVARYRRSVVFGSRRAALSFGFAAGFYSWEARGGQAQSISD